MIESKVLLTGFRESSAEQLINKSNGFDTLILPNDKVKDSEMLINVILSEKYDYVFSFGQRPIIKNKVHIETTARNGIASVETDVDCEQVQKQFETNGITTKISHNAGTSYCNSLYYNGLNYINQNKLKTKMVFVHIPLLKNIDDISSFFTLIMDTISRIA